MGSKGIVASWMWGVGHVPMAALAVIKYVCFKQSDGLELRKRGKFSVRLKCRTRLVEACLTDRLLYPVLKVSCVEFWASGL